MTAPGGGERLLVVHLGALGDFVVTFPALIRLGKRFAHVDVVARGGHGALACALGLASRHDSADAAVWAELFSGGTTPSLRERIAGYTHILLLSFSRDLETRFRRMARAAVYRISPRPQPSRAIHVSAHLLRGLGECGLIGLPERVLRYPFMKKSDFAPDAENAADGAILIHPGAGSPKKMWPLERFVGVADRLAETGHAVAFLLGPAERMLAPVLKKSVGPGIRLHLTVELMALWHLLRSARALIGNDSGVSHLSAFCGVPTVAVFGPSDPVRWKPVGRAVAVVRPPGRVKPCFETDPDHCPAETWLRRIDALAVLEALERVTGDR